MPSKDEKISTSLKTFAFVREQYEQTGDIVSGLVPLFAPAIKKNAGKIFDPTEFSQELADMFGLKINPLAVEDFAPRLEKHGLLKNCSFESSLAQYVYANPEIPKNSDISNKVNRLLAYVVKFTQERLNESNIYVSDERVESEFFERLSYDSYFVRRDSRKEDTKHSSSPLKDRELNLDRVFDYLISKSILNARDALKGDASIIDDISAGSLVSEIITGLQKPPERGSKTQSLIAYLDTPIVLPYINLSYKERCVLINDLLSDARQMGIQFAVFDHTVSEMHRVVTRALSQTGTIDAGDVSVRISSDPGAKSRAQTFKLHPRDTLKKFGIRVVDFDKKYSELYKYFSAEHETDLLSYIRPWGEIRAREADVSSLANVYRIVASGRISSSILSSAAVFISSNTAVIYDGLKYFKDSKLLKESQAPIFITDRQLAGLAWIAVGGRAAELPQKLMITNCIAAIAPKQDVLSKMRAFLEDLDPDSKEDFEAVVSDKRCGYYLMDLTLGSPELLTEENYIERFEKLKRSTAAKIESEKNAEIGRLLEEKESSKQILEHISRLNEEKVLNLCEKICLRQARRVYVMWLILLYCAASGLLILLVQLLPFFRGTTIVGLRMSDVVTIAAVACPIIAGFFQFWRVPDLLFGRFVLEKAKKAFRAKGLEFGIWEEVKDIEIDWEHFHIKQ